MLFDQMKEQAMELIIQLTEEMATNNRKRINPAEMQALAGLIDALARVLSIR